MVLRSVDGGKHWESPYVYPTSIMSQIECSTPLDRDTVYAGGQSNCFMLISLEREELEGRYHSN